MSIAHKFPHRRTREQKETLSTGRRPIKAIKGCAWATGQTPPFSPRCPSTTNSNRASLNPQPLIVEKRGQALTLTERKNHHSQTLRLHRSEGCLFPCWGCQAHTQTFISVGLKLACCSAVLMNVGSCPQGQECGQQLSGTFKTAKSDFQVSVMFWLKTNCPLENSRHLPVLLAWNPQESVVRKQPYQILTGLWGGTTKDREPAVKNSKPEKGRQCYNQDMGKKRFPMKKLKDE